MLRELTLRKLFKQWINEYRLFYSSSDDDERNIVSHLNPLGIIKIQVFISTTFNINITNHDNSIIYHMD